MQPIIFLIVVTGVVLAILLIRRGQQQRQAETQTAAPAPPIVGELRDLPAVADVALPVTATPESRETQVVETAVEPVMASQPLLAPAVSVEPTEAPKSAATNKKPIDAPVTPPQVRLRDMLQNRDSLAIALVLREIFDLPLARRCRR